MGRTSYPHSFKLKVVSEVISNENKKGVQTKVAKKYGISNFAVYSWVKKYRDEVELTKENLKPIETIANKVEQENEVLKSIIILKELEIRQLMNQYNLHEIRSQLTCESNQ